VNDSPDRTHFPPYFCRDCGSNVGFRSRRRNFAERYLLPLFLLQPVRCGECFRRDYRLIFTHVRERMPEPVKMPPPKQTGASESNVA
jgi:hypothetical protein